MGCRRKFNDAGMIPREMLQDILMKLPIKDVARSCCVSRSWRGAVRDPSFRKLHAENNYAVHSAEAEVLLLNKIYEPGQSRKTDVVSLSSRKAMCSFTIPDGYVLANICNGLLCFVQNDDAFTPAVVCNPATGETLALPKAPPLGNEDDSHLFALGFSPPTNEYKLFRLSFPPYSSSSEERVDVDVCTLGDTHGWRKSGSFLSPSRPMTRPHTHSAPVLIDGKLHVVTRGWRIYPTEQAAKGVLVVNVPAETCRTYPLPVNLGSYPYDKPQAFELNGRLCFAADVLITGHPKVLRFWVMSPPPSLPEKKESDDQKEPHWDLRYSFYVKDPHYARSPWSAWFDQEMLWYMRDEILYKYDTRSLIPDHGRLIRWDKKFRPATLLSQWRLNVHGGYRPTLLSPRIFELPPSQHDTIAQLFSA